MKKYVAIVLLLSTGCAASTLLVDASAFCVRPGDSEAQVTRKCDAARRDTEATEEGPLVVYFVSHGKYRFAAEVDGDQVSRIRFTDNPLPIPGLRIGDTFASVRKVAGEQRLEASAAEQTYIALAGSQGISLSFDTSGVTTDWFFARPLDEVAIARARLTSVNFGESDD